MGLDKEKFGTVCKEALKVLAKAVARFVGTKLIPKMTERRCVLLQKYTEKFLDKVGDLIEKAEKASSTKTKIRNLFLLKLCLDSMDAVASTFTSAADKIREEVDFSILTDVTKADKVALALDGINTGANPEDIEEDGGCGPDGCEIA